MLKLAYTNKGGSDMTLSMAPTGKSLIVNKVNGRDEVRNRLANLGFVEGAECHVVSELNGNLITTIKNTRIALDKSLGNRIIVESKEEKSV